VEKEKDLLFQVGTLDHSLKRRTSITTKLYRNKKAIATALAKVGSLVLDYVVLHEIIK
jgi:hypothetical protein